MTTVSQSDWLTAGEAAEYLKVKKRSLLLWVRQGKVKAYALSGTKRRIWRFRREDLDTALFGMWYHLRRRPCSTEGDWNEKSTESKSRSQRSPRHLGVFSGDRRKTHYEEARKP